jgi:hypothetical protein
MTLAMLALALLQHPTSPAVRTRARPAVPDTVAGRACNVVIDTVGHSGRQVEVRQGETNFFAGGGVRAHCRGTRSTLAADSLAWFAGVGRLDLMGQVQIRDTAISIDATTASYFLHQERLEAHKDVVAVSHPSGSILRGPNLTYYRVTKGIRDTSEMYATSRPTITYRATPDSGEPYVIVGDRVRMKGNDRMWAGGHVTIDRSNVAARADSMTRDQTAGLAVLIGRPQVQGKGLRTYRLVGRRIEMGLRDREVHLIKALGQGEATGTDWRLTADTIHLKMAAGKLQQVVAWGDSSRPHALSSQHTIDADSLVLDAPDEVLTAARAYRHARSTSKRDTTATAELDWIAGDTITAHWTQTAGAASKAKSSLDRLVARGSAHAFTHIHNRRDASVPPSLNYSRGAVIDITMKADRMDRVIVTGQADGMQLEPLPPPPDTTQRDTTKTGRPRGAAKRGAPPRDATKSVKPKGSR